MTNQIKQIIKNLFTEKTADSDNVLNEILKMTYKTIKKNLIIMITQCFINSSLSLYLKKFTIVMLHKEKKKNYLHFNSYYLIALKNTIVKLLKKIVTKHITYTAEKHNLLI